MGLYEDSDFNYELDQGNNHDNKATEPENEPEKGPEDGN